MSVRARATHFAISFIFVFTSSKLYLAHRKKNYTYGTPFTRIYILTRSHIKTSDYMCNWRLHGLHIRRREDLNLWFIIIENAVLWNGIDKNIFMISYYKNTNMHQTRWFWPRMPRSPVETRERICIITCGFSRSFCTIYMAKHKFSQCIPGNYVD